MGVPLAIGSEFNHNWNDESNVGFWNNIGEMTRSIESSAHYSLVTCFLNPRMSRSLWRINKLT